MGKDLSVLFKKSGLSLTKLCKLSNTNLSTCQRYVQNKVKKPADKYIDAIYSVLKEWDDERDDINAQDTKQEEMNIDIGALKDRLNQNTIRPYSTAAPASKPSTGYISNYSNTTGYSYNTIDPKRKEIWYVRNQHAIGNEMWSGSKNRPCIVIQNDKLSNIGTYLCVYLTKQQKDIESPSLVTIQTNVISTAICHQINALSRDRFVNCVGSVTEIEMSLIERAILTATDIKISPKSDVQHNIDYISLKTQLSIYKQFYEDYIKIHSIR